MRRKYLELYEIVNHPIATIVAYVLLNSPMKGATMIKRLIVLTAFLTLTACGGSDNSAYQVINGIAYELDVTGIDCFSGPPTGPAIPGADGIMAAPLQCNVTFQTPGYYADVLSITVFDVREAYNQIGIPLVHGAGLVEFYVTQQGIPQAPVGQVIFSAISNVVGSDVCGKYEAFTGNGEIHGQFCDTVRIGY